jgi:hypothetical protein
MTVAEWQVYIGNCGRRGGWMRTVAWPVEFCTILLWGIRMANPEHQVAALIQLFNGNRVS